MNPRGLTVLLLAGVLVASAACSGSKSAKSKADASAGGSSGQSSSSSSEGGSSGGGIGPADAGAGIGDAGSPARDAHGDVPVLADSGSPKFDGGRGGTGGSGTGSSAAGGAGGRSDAGSPGACRVDIAAASEPYLTDLVPGDNRTLTVKATIVWGTTTPETPTWQWAVIGPDRTTLTTTDVPTSERNAASIQFPLLASGKYEISVNVTPTCHGRTTATAGKEWPLKYFIRVLPPPNPGTPSGQICVGSNRWCPSEDAVPYEQTIKLEPKRPLNMGQITLPTGSPVNVDPVLAPDSNTLPDIAVPSTIHIAPHLTELSSYSSWSVDGESTNQKSLRAVLNSNLQYDVLVVPGAPTNPNTEPFPPFRTRGRAEDFQETKFQVAPGVKVQGTVRTASGPLAGVRIFLRADPADQVTLPLPSTWGTTDALGSYSLRVGLDTYSLFSVIVIPPTGSTLPQVTIPKCIHLGNFTDGATMSNLDFTWNALASTNLTVTVMTTDGQSPAPSVRVRLQSQDKTNPENTVPDPGTLSIDGTKAESPSGSLRLEDTTDTSGVVRFGEIPKVGYHLVLLPPDDLSDAAISTTDLDLSGANNDERRIFALSRKVKLTGVISPAESSRGGRIVAIDIGTDILENTISSAIDDTGRYTLMAAPGRGYRFSVEPAPGRNLPSRIPLYGVTATKEDTSQVDRKLPVALKVSGTVWYGSSVIPGAIVQVYCLQSGTSGCMDPQNPTPTLPMPVVETASQADGSYGFYLPDPGTGD